MQVVLGLGVWGQSSVCVVLPIIAIQQNPRNHSRIIKVPILGRHRGLRNWSIWGVEVSRDPAMLFVRTFWLGDLLLFLDINIYIYIYLCVCRFSVDFCLFVYLYVYTCPAKPWCGPKLLNLACCYVLQLKSQMPSPQILNLNLVSQ